MSKQTELELDFLEGQVKKDDVPVMSLEELLFLIDSAVQYNTMFPIQQSEEFIAELRERVGMGFTKEQFNEMKEAMKEWNE